MTSTDTLSNAPTRSASPINADAITVEPTKSLADAVRNVLHPQRLCANILSADTNGTEYRRELAAVWNKDVVHNPAVIIQPENTLDVQGAVKAAVKLNARLVIAGGRHGHDCLAEDALVVDMSKMKKVAVDPIAKTVTVEGGCKLGDMDQACKPFGLAAVTGTNPDTGVVGLSTAGGGGYMSRLYGMAVDNFVSAEVVLATGEAVLATKDNEHRDLLWGLQGAGSNFGIVTKLTMKLHPVDKVYGGMVINVAPSEARCKKVLTNWRDWILDAPRSVMSMAVLPCGAPVVPMAVCELDQEAVPQEAKAKCTANKLPSLKPFHASFTSRMLSGGLLGKSFGAALSIRPMKRMQYHADLQPQLESVQAGGYYYDASCIVPEMSEEVISTLVEFTRKKHVNNQAAIIIFPLGGAIADAPIDSTSFWGSGRQAKGFWIIIEGKFSKDKSGVKREKVVTWVKALRHALAKFNVSDTAHTLDGNMESVLAGAEAIFGPNYERIRKVKGKYDSTNFFKCNRNIDPA